MKRIMVLLVAIVISLYANAQQFKAADIFTDNMVLQQKSQVPVWGYAKPGSKVAVSTSWNGRSYSATADVSGRWTVDVATSAAGGPYTVTINGEKKIVIKNVLLGEVWLASGQSNMSMPLKGYYCQAVEGSNEAILNATGKKVRFINIPTLAAYRPLKGLDASWQEASTANAGECSAVCWFFADFLLRQINVPVGIINASYSGSNLEAWMSPEACVKTNVDIPEQSDETSPWISNVPTALYNGMINPVVGYGIRGLLWYQGESNIFNVPRYAPFVAAMVESWREKWGRGELPFYFAQIAPYGYKAWNFFTPQWPEISAYQREAQAKCLDIIPSSGMAVLMDVGDPINIHPSKKRQVGERLGMLALSRTYGINGYEATSPRYEKMVVEGDKAIIHFTDQHNGITGFDKPLQLFEIAGENRVFHKAEAWIDGDKGTVVVSNKYVKEPKAVRYAFKDYAQGELFGVGGLPVSSFRTDDWD